MRIIKPLFLLSFTFFSKPSFSQFPLPTEQIIAKTADATDVRMFDPYIGTWRGKSFDAKDGRRLHFVIEYSWFDRPKTIMQLRIIQVNEADNSNIQTMQGFYGYDPLNKRLYHYIYSLTGNTGFGAVFDFDKEKGTRSNALKVVVNGKPMEMRDHFELIDENTFYNKSYSWDFNKKEWELMNEGSYKKVE